jgi:RNA polymerase sigma-70 factor (ECF subfamily)
MNAVLRFQPAAALRCPIGVPEDRDHDLCARALGGDVRAFERLYAAHSGRVHALARRLAGADADELTQDVFVRAWQKLATFRGEGSFAGWLRTLAVRLVANHIRARLDRPAAAPEPPARMSPPELRLDLEAAIGRLPAGARAVFVLHDVEGYGHDEIAQLLGVTVGTTKSQLHRARALLRAALGGDPA